jgi:eukaryotic-like serine/threonine-protein kinase
MTPDQYQQIGQIYHTALEMEPDARAAFLDEACGSDDELRREVESLLPAREQAGSYLGAPALEVAAELIANQKIPSLAGHRLSHYQVL